MTFVPFQAEDSSPKPKGWRYHVDYNRDERGRFVATNEIDEGVEKRIKIDEHVLVPLGVTAAGGILANQLPQNQRSSKRVLEGKKDKKVKKSFAPIIKSADPFFNQKLAQQVSDLVMKMNIDEARSFTSLVVGDVIEQEIDDNLRTLQRHLDQTALKSLERIKKSVKRTVVSKNVNLDEVGKYIEALDKLERVIKAENPYDYGYRFKESDFRRDPSSGRFTTKIKVDPHKPALNPDQQAGLGIPNRPVSGRNRSAYQQEYAQIAEFLNTVAHNGSLGEHDVALVVQNEESGDRHIRPLKGKPNAGNIPGDDWDPSTERVVAVEARPTSLKLGGATFGLTNSLGAPISGTTAGVLSRGEDKLGPLATDWTKANNKSESDVVGSNERLYGRIEAGSKFLSSVAPFGSHAQIAGKFGEFVGSHGPEAEKVFGPTLRRTGYRYRGTEKRPDQDLLDEYEKKTGKNRQKLLPSEQRRFGSEALGDEERKVLNVMQREEVEAARQKKSFEVAERSGETIRRTRDVVHESGQMERRSNIPNLRDKRQVELALTDHEHAEAMNRGLRRFNAARAEARGGITESGMASGREVVANHLKAKGRFPEKNLYGLHLEAGNTPPSEGVIIDSNGKIAVQAVGYGDDHYLPFNLKNLGALKGGEYIRTRSVGGPTSEDIYTGLVSGARRLQVESRSGTFIIEFENDFRGGRRYNDKARRMVRRYEQLLDAVQSEQVKRSDVPPEVRQKITQEVLETPYIDSYSNAEKRTMIENKIEEFKTSPELSLKDESRLREQIAEATRNARSPREAKEIREHLVSVYNTAKEYKFRLNGLGYEAAMQALQEQFPYYIKTRAYPTRAGELSTEHDKGYVEPGRNRPTEAKAGLYGTAIRIGDRWGNGSKTGNKFSASRADYQGFRGGKPEAVGGSDGEVRVEDADGKDKSPVDRAREIRARSASRTVEAEKKKAAQPMALKLARFARQPVNADVAEALPGITDINDEGDAELWLNDPDNSRKLYDLIDSSKDQINFRNAIGQKLINDYLKAAGKAGRRPFSPERALIAGPNPSTFPEEGKAYQPGATPAEITEELSKLDRVKPLTSDLLLSDMSDEDLQDEIKMLANGADMLGSDDDLTDPEDKQLWLDAMKGLKGTDALPALMNGPGTLKQRIINNAIAVQKVRALKADNPDIKTIPQLEVRHDIPAPEGRREPREDYKEKLRSQANGIRLWFEAQPQAERARISPQVSALHRDAVERLNEGVDQGVYEQFQDQHQEIINAFIKSMESRHRAIGSEGPPSPFDQPPGRSQRHRKP